ncbi:polynucleotide adenylyltransferase PcnB [Arenicella xantha]|uniref:Poly(A) polymerase I n=1 Tax=Arenicella xantha TaxID=644221 RepID=A0A395JL50_9GAMM|nr:polynucleotide adenylyltransferase PcnB [Arenicella xantha]RBP51516.1 poly(A) polymerase [Arenicella xantha]
MKIPTITSATDAGINNADISDKALHVVQELQKAGYTAYLVGGCVRDLILGTKPKDFDISTNATPEQIKRTFGRNARIIGRRFKLVHVRYGYEVLEVATFRADASDRDKVGSNEMSEGDQGQLLRDNVYGTIEEDVVRRDFTVNSLYYNSVSGEILDFMDGIADIKAKKLRSIGEPEQRFTEDPVRMLRVIRFAAKLGFEMEPEALKMIEEQGKLLSHVSSARLFEEVLKLFHGGAAYDTYQLLRKYGLFKYLFPFTDSMVVDGVEGMPERALLNTDKRVNKGKPVIPAFLFACMMWDPVKADAQVLMDDGASESHAWRVAMNDGLRDQNQYVAVPRRLAEIILDIWNIHFRLIKRNPRMVKACLTNRRFRAAYDFLLLRTMVHEVDAEVGEWWTQIQEVDDEEREAMVAELNKTYKKERQPQNSQEEPNFNSVDYNVSNTGYDGVYVGGANDSFGNGGKPKPQQRRAGAGSGGGKKKKNGRRGKKVTRNAQSRPSGNAGPNSVGNAEGGGRRSKVRSKKKASRRRGPANGRRKAPGTEQRFVESRPADEFGVTSASVSKKKVKVRHKRKVSTDETPHF